MQLPSDSPFDAAAIIVSRPGLQAGFRIRIGHAQPPARRELQGKERNEPFRSGIFAELATFRLTENHFDDWNGILGKNACQEFIGASILVLSRAFSSPLRLAGRA